MNYYYSPPWFPFNDSPHITPAVVLPFNPVLCLKNVMSRNASFSITKPRECPVRIDGNTLYDYSKIAVDGAFELVMAPFLYAIYLLRREIILVTVI